MYNKENKTYRKRKKSKYSNELILKEIFPKNDIQRNVFDSFRKNNLLLHGYPGTGKTFIALYLVLNEIVVKNKTNKIMIFRSIVPTRNIGFLPGTVEEKIEEYETPYRIIINDLLGKPTAYDELKEEGILEFCSTSFVRGLTIDDSFVIIDEYQNMDFHELDSLITRIGINTKVLIIGDKEQSDLRMDKGLSSFTNIIKKMSSFVYHEFGIEEIVRSSLVKEYLKIKYGVEKNVKDVQEK